MPRISGSILVGCPTKKTLTRIEVRAHFQKTLNNVVQVRISKKSSSAWLPVIAGLTGRPKEQIQSKRTFYLFNFGNFFRFARRDMKSNDKKVYRGKVKLLCPRTIRNRSLLWKMNKNTVVCQWILSLFWFSLFLANCFDWYLHSQAERLNFRAAPAVESSNRLISCRWKNMQRKRAGEQRF